MNLKRKNDEYREELKTLSLQLDEILENQKKPKQEIFDINAAIEVSQKKIKILEHEIKKLKMISPRTTNSDRLTLESTVNKLKEEIKTINTNNKELERKLIDLQRLQPDSNKELIEKKLSELRMIKEKIKQKEEKYAHEKKIHEQNLEEISKLQAKIKEKERKNMENQIDILNIGSKTENYYSNDLEGIQKVLFELEQ